MAQEHLINTDYRLSEFKIWDKTEIWKLLRKFCLFSDTLIADNNISHEAYIIKKDEIENLMYSIYSKIWVPSDKISVSTRNRVKNFLGKSMENFW